jgi:hypothetical protein
MNTPTQTSFAELEYASKKRQTRREKFLAEMEQVGKRLASPHRQLVAAMI